jgi:hypothetical protein
MNSLKPEPDQYDSYYPKSHLLPGEWAKKQLMNGGYNTQEKRRKNAETTDLERALNAERAQHEYWENWQGVTPGRPVYENPKVPQNTMLPSAKYGTEGQGYGS